jgi:hypothetical protein
MLAFEGNTAPYLQYVVARVRSILRKARTEGVPVPGEDGTAMPEVIRKWPTMPSGRWHWRSYVVDDTGRPCVCAPTSSSWPRPSPDSTAAPILQAPSVRSDATGVVAIGTERVMGAASAC